MEVLNTSHRRDAVVDRLTVGPVRSEWKRRDRAVPRVDVLQCARRLVPRAGDDADAPRAVVGRQSEDRDRAVVLQQAGDHRRHAAVGATEVAAVVDEAAVFAFLDRRTRTGGLQPRRQRRTATERVDDEVRTKLITVRAAHADDVWCAIVDRGADEYAVDRDAPADLDAARLSSEA